MKLVITLYIDNNSLSCSILIKHIVFICYTGLPHTQGIFKLKKISGKLREF